MKFKLQILLGLLLAAVPALYAAQQQSYDLIIRGGRVIDGAGNGWYRADVALQGETIAAIGRLDGATARRVIEARGAVVAPGFIDAHSHARRTIFEETKAENYIRQGVTTAIEGPDGSSPLPLKPFFDKLAAARIAINMGALVGQGSIREHVIGLVNRRATPDEIEKMKELVKQAMEDGALGLSTGLFYVPGNYTPTEEVIELAKVAGRMGGVHTSHMRDEAAGVLKSVEETIAIGERGGLPTQVTHHKIIGKGNWGRSVDTLRLIAEARARGVDVTIDQYPYTASSTGLAALLPQWSQEGENLAEIAAARGRSSSFDDAAETVMEIVGKGCASAIFHAIDEDDLVRILKDPLTMIASDGGVEIPGRGVPHPRNYGTFARVLGVYVREKRALSLEDAIRKMTSLPAQRLGLYDRGLLRPGMKADVVIFDPERVRDRATFADPHQYAEGVSFVIVNGTIVLDDGKMTEARPGRVLSGPAGRR